MDEHVHAAKERVYRDDHTCPEMCRLGRSLDLRFSANWAIVLLLARHNHTLSDSWRREPVCADGVDALRRDRLELALRRRRLAPRLRVLEAKPEPTERARWRARARMGVDRERSSIVERDILDTERAACRGMILGKFGIQVHVRHASLVRGLRGRKCERSGLEWRREPLTARHVLAPSALRHRHVSGVESHRR